MASIDRVVIFGLGAVGGTIAAALSEAGHDVIGIARGRQLHALQEGPLLLRMPGGDLLLALNVVSDPADITFRSGDAILLTMKTQDTWPALLALRAAGWRKQPIFCFQNSISNEDMASRLFPNVYGATVMMPATYVQPGEIIANGAPKIGLFDIGRYPSGLDAASASMAIALDGTRMGGYEHADVMASKRGKLLLNVSNAVDAVVEQDGHKSSIGATARAEAIAAFKAAGLHWDNVDLDDPRRKEFMQITDVAGAPRFGSSTRQSLTRGTGSVETDYLNGEICRLGRLYGVPTPVNAFLAQVTAEMASQGTPPGRLTTGQLDARLAAWRAQ
ncbi:MAG: 2-dehydropantoate 2-reductase N-terminal domain-containing protein [Pseudomonadota bacterium]